MNIGQVGVVVVADGTDCQAARTVAKRTDYAQQSLPEAEDFPVPQQFAFGLSILADEVSPEFQDRRESEFLGLGRAFPLVYSEVSDGIRRAGIKATAAGFADANLFGDAFVGLDRCFRQNAC
ncbi:MAG: hypothetical protein EBT18_10315 [Gammaproteobacteria bacterium]|nr:hypothetical protein [Gammaproteobacteria bacterium]